MEHKKLMLGAEMLEKVDNQFNLIEVIAKSAMPFGEVFTATNVLNAVSSVLAKKLGFVSMMLLRMPHSFLPR